ncbi:MAG: elongation factor P [Nitrospirae bacterium RBG_16_64_22]|nr:MAG: elongation factor P [Nitrospirae bacterium RBG_16_64_22]
MLSTSEIRNGAKIEIDGEPFIIVDFQHVKPGKGGGFVRTKLKSLKTGNVIDRTYRSGEKLDTPDLEEKTMQFLYHGEGQYHFMDTATYEQLFLTADHLGQSRDFLKESMVVNILFHNGRAIGVDLPIFVELAIAETDPGVKGDTASGGAKPAVLESGATVRVPLYLNVGDIIKVDTRTGSYVERIRAAG